MKIPPKKDIHIELYFDQVNDFDIGMWLVALSRDGDPSGYHSKTVDRFKHDQYDLALKESIKRGEHDKLRVIESESDGTKVFHYIP